MKTWKTVDGPIEEHHLDNVWSKIRDGFGKAKELARFFVLKPGDRRIDRALQLLKAQGRIKYDHHGRRWSVVEGGGK